jgi:ubiquinol-cytochrome c reductase cytochrome c1 subunit
MQARLNASWLGRPGAELYELIRTTMPAETPGSLSNAQYMDVAAFLMWAAEPHMMARKQTGFVAVIFLVLLTSLLYLTNKRLWAGVKGKKHA